MRGKYLERVEELLRRVAFGETLISICREKRMPSEQTVYAWRSVGHRLYKPGFAERLAAARAMGREALQDKLLDTARDPDLSEARRKAEMDAIKAVLGRSGGLKQGSGRLESGSGEVVVRVVYEEV